MTGTPAGPVPADPQDRPAAPEEEPPYRPRRLIDRTVPIGPPGRPADGDEPDEPRARRLLADPASDLLHRSAAPAAVLQAAADTIDPLARHDDEVRSSLREERRILAWEIIAILTVALFAIVRQLYLL
ncbi:MAG: hypothetical protein ACK5LS_06540 [Propioniciclava sp.]